jgi:phage repressor protein C with HTH and peptisase S24 domain
MTDIASRITSAREAKKLNQSQLARMLGVTPQAVQGWESGKAIPRNKKLINLCEILEVSVGHLLDNEDIDQTLSDSPSLRIKIVRPEFLLEDKPARDPLGYQAFMFNDLKRKGVHPGNAICLYLSGNSMQPVMPHKTLLGINRGEVDIVDGSVYAIAQQGEIRIKLAYRSPGAGIRLSCYNRAEHPDETYSAAEIEAQGIEVKGRVFWMSQFLG